MSQRLIDAITDMREQDAYQITDELLEGGGFRSTYSMRADKPWCWSARASRKESPLYPS